MSAESVASVKYSRLLLGQVGQACHLTPEQWNSVLYVT